MKYIVRKIRSSDPGWGSELHDRFPWLVFFGDRVTARALPTWELAMCYVAIRSQPGYAIWRNRSGNA